MDKKGQVTIFIIIAIIIVVGGVAVYSLRGKGIFAGAGGELNPNEFLKSCIEPDMQKAITTLSAQGGYLNPEGFVLYDDVKVKYLCYSSEYYRMCTVQQPMIKAHYEKELKNILEPKAEICMANLKKEYESRNYQVSSEAVKANVSIQLKNIRIEFLTSMSVAKGAETRRFEKFDIDVQSKMFEILGIAQTIVNFEATIGGVEPNLFVGYYPETRIEKNKLSDGTSIYKLTDVVTSESFTFASRSLAWAPGYGLPEPQTK